MIEPYSTLARSRRALAWSAQFFCVMTLAAFSSAQDQQPDLTQLSPEQLSKIEVTSVSRKQQRLGDTAAAVYVITQQDIRHSTATSIPELLQTVPGLDVAHINGSRWAISARGFNGFYQDTLLVLIDGRSAFDPLFNGVFWNEQDFLLEDIERIEVIRGPGSTMWGSNAVHGIINIITKSAQDTQGSLVSSGMSSEERSSASARYGGKLGRSTSYRIYSKYYDDGPAGTLNGQPSHDSARLLSGGVRLDSTSSGPNAFMLEGQGFSGTSGIDSKAFFYTPPFTANHIDNIGQEGENVLGRWTHKALDGSATTLQASYSHIVRPQTAVDINGEVAIATFQHERPLGTRHDLVTGVEFAYKAARTESLNNIVSWDPTNPITRTASAFVQDEMLFANGRVRVTTGLRLEHNSISGFAFHPNVRGLWKLSQVHTLWLGYSSASPSPAPDDTTLRTNLAAFRGPTGGTQVLRLMGNPNIDPEHLHAFELGYRVQPGKMLSLDIATFYNRYTKLIEPELGQPFFESGPPPRLVLPLIKQNDTYGYSFGGEFAAKWTPAKALRFDAVYSFMEMQITQLPGVFGQPASALENETPRHRLALNTSVDLVSTVTLNTLLSFTDSRTSQELPGYTGVDSSLIWRPFSRAELKLGVKDLFNKEHVEFVDVAAGASTVLKRSIYGRATWRF